MHLVKSLFYKINIGLILSFVVIVMGTLFLYDETRYYDSFYYWDTGMSIFVDKTKISLLEFPETFRGYFYPTVLAFLRIISQNIFQNEHVLFIILNSLLVAITISVLIPRIFYSNISQSRQIIGSIIFSLLVIIFLNTHLINSLSDFPAAALMLLAFVLIKILLEKKIKTLYGVSIFGFCIGCCLYASYNTRVIYLYPGILVIIFFIFQAIRTKNKQIFITMLAICSGIFLIAYPQMCINEKHIGEFTPRVITEKWVNYEEKLQMWHVIEGMRYKQYITYVGDDNIYPYSSIYFNDDKIGNRIWVVENDAIEENPIKAYINIWLKYPSEMVTIYVNHLISYITPIYGDHTFIRDFNIKNIYLYFFLNAFIWITSIGGLFLIDGKIAKVWIKENLLNLILLLLFILPSIMIIVGIPEIRFVLSLYLLLYAFFCYGVDFEKIYLFTKNHIFKVFIMVLAIVAFWITGITNILSDAYECTFFLSGFNFSNNSIIIIEMIKGMGSVGIIIGLYAIYIEKIKDLNVNVLKKKIMKYFTEGG